MWKIEKSLKSFAQYWLYFFFWSCWCSFSSYCCQQQILKVPQLSDMFYAVSPILKLFTDNNTVAAKCSAILHLLRHRQFDTKSATFVIPLWSMTNRYLPEAEICGGVCLPFAFSSATHLQTPLARRLASKVFPFFPLRFCFIVHIETTPQLIVLDDA